MKTTYIYELSFVNPMTGDTQLIYAASRMIAHYAAQQLLMSNLITVDSIERIEVDTTTARNLLTSSNDLDAFN